MKDKIKHIMICRESLTGVGGAERVLFEQSEAIVKKNIKCSVLLLSARPDLLLSFHKKVKIIVIGQKKYDDILFFKNLFKIRKEIIKQKPDLVIALQSLSDYLKFALFSLNTKYILYKYTSLFYIAGDTKKYSFLHRKVFNEIHSSLLSYTENIPSSWKPSFKYFLLNEYFAIRDFIGTVGAFKVLTLTSKSAWELNKLYDIKPEIWTPGHSFLEHIPNSKKKIKDFKNKVCNNLDTKIVLSVNRLEFRKRVNLAVEGFSYYHKSYNSNSKLIIIGIGEDEKSLKKKVKNLNITNAVNFVGLVSDDDLILYYEIADACISMIWGSWAISVIEPLLYNKPQIISNEIPDLLDGIKNLYKVDLKASSIGNALNTSINESELDSVSQMKKLLDWNTVTDKMLSLINQKNS